MEGVGIATHSEGDISSPANVGPCGVSNPYGSVQRKRGNESLYGHSMVYDKGFLSFSEQTRH